MFTYQEKIIGDMLVK